MKSLRLLFLKPPSVELNFAKTGDCISWHIPLRDSDGKTATYIFLLID